MLIIFICVILSFGVLDDAPCGTEIVAYVDENFQTIDQQYHEFIKVKYLCVILTCQNA
jgi:hypothetical protein